MSGYGIMPWGLDFWGVGSGTFDISGLIEGQSTITGDVKAIVAISGLIAGQSEISGDCAADVAISGLIEGQSTITGVVEVERAGRGSRGYVLFPPGGGFRGYVVSGGRRS